VTCIPTARQRLGKHIPAGANASNDRISTARQRSVNTPKTIRDNRRSCFPWGSPRDYITGSSKGSSYCRELGRVLEMAVEGNSEEMIRKELDCEKQTSLPVVPTCMYKVSINPIIQSRIRL
jgi:hypothetical protein